MTMRIFTDIRTRFLGCLGALAIIIFASPADATKLYKWVDSDGNISYQDRPPPKNAKILEEREIKAPEPTASLPDVVPVVVYTVPECPRCVEVIAWLTNRAIPTQEVSLQEDREAQRQILDLSNGLRAPALLLDEQFVLDTSEESMLDALEAAGYQPQLPIVTQADRAPTDVNPPTASTDVTPSDAPDSTATESETGAPSSDASPITETEDIGDSLFDENFNEIIDPNVDADGEPIIDVDPDTDANPDAEDQTPPEDAAELSE